MWYALALVGLVLLVLIVVIIVVSNGEELTQKETVERIYEERHRDNIEKERRWNQLVDHYMQYTCDLVPYDDPDYNVKVREMAESLAYTEMELDHEMELQDELHNGETQEETKELPW